MRFILIDLLPYLVSNGVMYPVEITKSGKGWKVRYGAKHGRPTDLKGRYSLMEVVAKCGNLCSIKKTRRKKTDDGVHEL